MRTAERLIVLIVVTGAAFWTGACASKTIGHVLADPARYENHAVTVSGEVVQSYSVLGRGAYELRDQTGRLWVLSDRGDPREGARVKVRGTVRDVIDAGPLIPADGGFGVLLRESSRETRE